jgi:hypothetical protein
MNDMRKLMEAVAPLFQEGVRDDNKEAMFLNAVQEIIKDAEEAGAYGDVRDESIERAYSYYQKGDFGSAVEEILANFSDQDGGEVDALQGVYDDAVSDMEYLAKGGAAESAVTESSTSQAIEELRDILDHLDQLGEQAHNIVRMIDPGEAERLDAYDAFQFGSSSNKYDNTLASFVEDLESGQYDDE